MHARAYVHAYVCLSVNTFSRPQRALCTCTRQMPSTPKAVHVQKKASCLHAQILAPCSRQRVITPHRTNPNTRASDSMHNSAPAELKRLTRIDPQHTHSHTHTTTNRRANGCAPKGTFTRCDAPPFKPGPAKNNKAIYYKMVRRWCRKRDQCTVKSTHGDTFSSLSLVARHRNSVLY